MLVGSMIGDNILLLSGLPCVYGRGSRRQGKEVKARQTRAGADERGTPWEPDNMHSLIAVTRDENSHMLHVDCSAQWTAL